MRELIAEKRSIYSASMVQKLVKEQYGQDVSAYMVLRVMKEKFRLSYRKIKRVPFSGNSERSKVLRSLYAQKMLEVYQTGQRVINVDESWIPHADFHQRRWKRRGMLNTAPDKTLGQKVNIITAMSSDGEVWIALTTINTDSDVLMLFMTHLAKALTKESADWRSSTIFLLDGVWNYMSRILYIDFLFCVSPIGCLPQVGREPCLLRASGSADRPQRPVQLLGCASGAVVRAAQAGRHQPDQRRHREAVSACRALIFSALSRMSCRSSTPRWKKSRGRRALPAFGTASSTCSCTSRSSPFELSILIDL